ncbi:DUF6518 family protein [Agromyces archimandritae]|uniref:Uncharacterized protein n=1 Tax=Agromyces archimandritae TaxID=2781962 RepID=A0A975FL72_9MICO|nr:DUF6518 family protein [Agromyces archimandritae]QTX03782.1 hypothetical protein G127AT_10660 [Agromyces archimandritae]
MTSAPPRASARASARPALRTVGRLAAAFAIALVLGALTSFGQAALPDALASLANSAGGWTIPTAIVVGLLARGRGEAAVGGALAFVALTLGYALASTARGFPFDPLAWSLIGVVAGPVVGLSAFALRRPRRRAAGAAILGGILLGEGVYGLTVVSETTSPVWWWIELALGAALALAVALAALGRRRLGDAILAAGGAVLVAAAFWAAFSALPLIWG